MSCEGNRLKFFEQIQAALGLDARTLEKVYQAGKAGWTAEQDQGRLTEKTRLLFGDMQAVGLKPPTHSPDGLPKPDSRAGYAAVLDYLRQQDVCKPKEVDAKDVHTWPLSINPLTLLDDRNNLNGTGFMTHRYKQVKYDTGTLDWLHIWFGLPAFGGLMNERHERILGKGVRWTDDLKKRVDAFASSLDASGNLADGWPPDGFDVHGFDRFGCSVHGLSREDVNNPNSIDIHAKLKANLQVKRLGRATTKLYTVDIEGFCDDGFCPEHPDEDRDRDRFGFDRLGFRNGRSWTGYDENGLDANGKPAPAMNGYDAWGYERKSGLTAPDAQGRRYNLIGWVYDPDTGDCINPNDPSQRMKHDGSWSYSTKRRKVVLKRSYVPTSDDMKKRLRHPEIRLQEARQGGPFTPYLGLPTEDRNAMLALNDPRGRYLYSEQRLRDEPHADFLGVWLRCPKCGQFTGAAPHACPHYGGRKTLVMSTGLVMAFARGAYRNKKHDQDAMDDILQAAKYWYLSLQECAGREYHQAMDVKTIPILWGQQVCRNRESDEFETAIVLEAPHSPLGEKFDPDYHGGVYAGYHWKSGLDPEGYDPLGFHYLTGFTRSGFNRRSVEALSRVKAAMQEAENLLRGKSVTEVLAATYSRIATAIAGAGRRVTITEDGGPRPGMFWTDMRGQIQAERYPLQNTPHNDEYNNLVAMKAGIYHELGHEEDTPPGIFARVVEIARGKEEVEGIPRAAAGLVAEIYNILEDGRMERVQSRRRRGVAAVLAADAIINPRWDEKVGEGIPLQHQVMGLMLYRSLPYFRVRQEVLEAAPERVRKMFAEVAPLVDRAMHSPEDAFQASIEITRRLLADDEMRSFAEQMTQDGSQGGQWVEGGNSLIISALPHLGSGVAPDRSLSLPGAGRQAGSSKEDEQPGDKRQAGSGAGSDGEVTSLEPEVDEDFFRSISSQTSVADILDTITDELRVGVRDITRSPVGRALQKPLDATGNIVIEDPETPSRTWTVQVLKPSVHRKSKAELANMRAAARTEGQKVARRLETLREEVRRKARLQTSGNLDRRRFKRALAGAETVYQQTRTHDLTSLALSIQLDMSGSMMDAVRSGKLAAVALTLEEALQRLDAEYMVTGFGTSYALFKTFGDERISDDQAQAMMSHDLGGTQGMAAFRLGLLGLKETKSANKLHVVMTDGAFDDTEKVVKQAEEMRRSGIVPFGIFLGNYAPTNSMDRVFGAGNWVRINRLEQMSEVVARRIEQIYRKILATR